MSEYLTPAQVQGVVDEINAYFAETIIYTPYRVGLLYRVDEVQPDLYAVYAIDPTHQRNGRDFLFARLDGHLTIASEGRCLYDSFQGIYPNGQGESEDAHGGE